MTRAPSMREAAVGYARRGWPVFPLAPRGKVPLIARAHGGRGFHDATTDEARIQLWWARWPNANIGVATGSASGIDVLDVDPKHAGDASLAALVDANGPLPPTLTADTGSGGTHYVFRHHPGMRRSVGFQPGLDYLADRGYVVAAPSVQDPRPLDGQRSP